MSLIEEPKDCATPTAVLDERKSRPTVALITNFATHYRIKVFAALARMCDTEFYFYSDGGEWYWHGPRGAAAKNGSKDGFVGHYFRGFWLGRTRIVPGLIWVFLTGKHDVYIKSINGKFALPVVFAVARIRRKPFILWSGVWNRLGTRFHRLIFPCARFLYRNADALVVYGEHVKRYLIEEGVDPARIFLAPQAVDNDHYRRLITAAEQEQLKTRHDIPTDRKIVLYLGRLEPGKGLEYLLQGFAQVRNETAILLLCGPGSETANLQNMAHQLGISDRVRFVGAIPAADTAAFYSISHVAVLPSVTTPLFREPWGLTVNEAFNQGVPVIATDAVGAAAGGLVLNGRNGFVVPERNPGAIRDALETILASDELRQSLGRNAVTDIASWTQERMAAGFRDAVDFVMAEREARKRKV